MFFVSLSILIISLLVSPIFCVSSPNCLFPPKSIENDAIWETDSPYSGPDWMQKAMKYLGQRTLQEITLPGTHDSGAFNFTDDLIELPDYIDVIVELADELGIDVIDIFHCQIY